MQVNHSSSISRSLTENAGSFTYDEEAGVLVIRCFGDVTVDSIASIWGEIVDGFSISEKMKGIVFDLSEGHFVFPASDYDHIVGFLKEHLDFFGRLRLGFVANDPHNIVVAMLVARADARYCLRPFTTLKAAIYWVQNVS
ncbi:hypothetical protein [Marinilabilia rubra]|uniref:STAS/SEC14 domain-containing protein n=1 Tax=Marinilabilia rubra TaxID=2162893 RepID=A0A2U2B4R9_9BACT|nr:hypothetical protein [Marinilabilia rubra]PWD98037.1 hypothetical protein DDZ16_17740 [Marinilabilia rubra]